MNTISKKKNKLEKAVSKFTDRHPRISYLVLFFCMPIFILLAVFICTMAITFPIAFIFNYI